jgi:D-sedoheptulose 7-phosphate isomerase
MSKSTVAISAASAIDGLLVTLERFRELAGQVDEIGLLLIDVFRRGGKVLTCGNGGSAADALHMAEELVGRYKNDRKSLPAISLAADPTLLTCIGNDFGYEQLFSRQIHGLAQEGDVLVAFSSSGNSANLLAALEAAKEKNVITVSVLGKDGGSMAGRADYQIIVPSQETARIQEVHTLILHSWLEQIEAVMVS